LILPDSSGSFGRPGQASAAAANAAPGRPPTRRENDAAGRRDDRELGRWRFRPVLRRRTRL